MNSKPKCFLLLFFLSVSRPSLTLPSIDESKVKSYTVKRIAGDNGDLFTVNMKDGYSCTKNTNRVDEWCRLLSAYHDSSTWNASSCSCTCEDGSRSFLPSLQTCINASSAASFGGEYRGRLVMRTMLLFYFIT